MVPVILWLETLVAACSLKELLLEYLCGLIHLLFLFPSTTSYLESPR